MPASIADLRAKAAEFASRYPRDPRVRITYGEVLMRNRDAAGAERELRASLAEESVWVQLFPRQLSHQARTLLAWVLVDSGRVDEAKATAQPVCSAATTGDFRAALDQKKLCGN
jgi:predicted Zn-dependent protease